MTVIEALASLGVQAVIVGDEPITEANYASCVTADTLPAWGAVVAKMQDGARAEITAEAGRRILARYPIHKQINIIRLGGQDLAAMSAWIDAVRARSDDLAAAPPADVTSDAHWLAV